MIFLCFVFFFFFLLIRRPPRSTLDRSSAASDVYKRQLLDHVQMEMELAELLGREVDLITRRAVESSRNPLRRREILETAQTVYTQ